MVSPLLFRDINLGDEDSPDFHVLGNGLLIYEDDGEKRLRHICDQRQALTCT